MQHNINDEVWFAAQTGESRVHKGKIVRANKKTATVSVVESTRYRAGVTVRVPYALVGTERLELESTGVSIGVTFRSTYADSNALWKVVSSRGRDWLCEVVNEQFEFEGKTYDGDYAGSQKVFMTNEIERAIKLGNFFDQKMDEHHNFYANLHEGQTIHYHNGFGQWVRCVVVNQDGKNVLKSVALLGNWHKSDLVRRLPTGSICYGYNAQKIIDGETMTPNASNLWENGCNGPPFSDDPTTLAPISLDIPEMTAEQSVNAELWNRVNQLRDILNDSSNGPQAILDLVDVWYAAK